MEDAPGFDMESRDPNNLNLHLQVLWDDLIGEPEGIRSMDCVWKSAFKVFRCSMDCCYNFLSVLCAIPIAFCVGCHFACLSFQHIWCVGPFLRDWRINCQALRNFCRVGLQSVCGPCCETCGLLFSQVRIRHHRSNGKEPSTPEDV